MAVPFWFDQTYYIAAKAANDGKTPEVTQGELDNAGYTGVEGAFRHYEEWGKIEKVAPFDPATFDADAYLAAKAANDGKDVAVTTQELADAGISPIDHFMKYAEVEKIDYQLSDAPVDPDQPGSEDVSEVAAALDAYQAANKALDEALEAAEVDTVAEAAGAANDAGAAVVFPAGVTGTLSATSSAEYDAAVIAEARAVLEEAVTEAKDTDKENLSNAKAVVAAQESYQDVLDEALEAEAALASAVAGFDKAHAGTGITASDFGAVTGGDYVPSSKNLIDGSLTTPVVEIPEVPSTPITADGTLVGAAGTDADAGSAIFTLTLDSAPAEDVTFSYTMSGNTKVAIASGTTGSITVKAGTTTGTAKVSLTDTEQGSSVTETLTMTISDPSVTATVSVTNDTGTDDLSISAGTDGSFTGLEIGQTEVVPAKPIIILDKDGELALGAGGKELAKTSEWPQKLLDALKAYQEAVGDIAGASDSLTKAVTEAGGDPATMITATDNDVVVNLGAEDAAQKIINAEKDLADFNKAVEEFTAAKAEYTSLAEMEEARDDALAAIEDAPEDGGLGLTIMDSSAFTADSDLYVVEESDVEVSLSKFGFSGEDMIFFGSKYSFVEATTTDIKDSWGKADAFEVFYEQDGKDLVLYMENVAAAGNATNDSDMTVITLTGVKIADVNFADGFALAGEASA